MTLNLEDVLLAVPTLIETIGEMWINTPQKCCEIYGVKDVLPNCATPMELQAANVMEKPYSNPWRFCGCTFDVSNDNHANAVNMCALAAVFAGPGEKYKSAAPHACAIVRTAMCPWVRTVCRKLLTLSSVNKTMRRLVMSTNVFSYAFFTGFIRCCLGKRTKLMCEKWDADTAESINFHAESDKLILFMEQHLSEEFFHKSGPKFKEIVVGTLHTRLCLPEDHETKRLEYTGMIEERGYNGHKIFTDTAYNKVLWIRHADAMRYLGIRPLDENADFDETTRFDVDVYTAMFSVAGHGTGLFFNKLLEKHKETFFRTVLSQYRSRPAQTKQVIRKAVECFIYSRDGLGSTVLANYCQTIHEYMAENEPGDFANATELYTKMWEANHDISTNNVLGPSVPPFIAAFDALIAAARRCFTDSQHRSWLFSSLMYVTTSLAHASLGYCSPVHKRRNSVLNEVKSRHDTSYSILEMMLVNINYLCGDLRFSAYVIQHFIGLIDEAAQNPVVAAVICSFIIEFTQDSHRYRDLERYSRSVIDRRANPSPPADHPPYHPEVSYYEYVAYNTKDACERFVGLLKIVTANALRWCAAARDAPLKSRDRKVYDACGYKIAAVCVRSLITTPVKRCAVSSLELEKHLQPPSEEGFDVVVGPATVVADNAYQMIADYAPVFTDVIKNAAAHGETHLCKGGEILLCSLHKPRPLDDRISLMGGLCRTVLSLYMQDRVPYSAVRVALSQLLRICAKDTYRCIQCNTRCRFHMFHTAVTADFYEKARNDGQIADFVALVYDNELDSFCCVNHPFFLLSRKTKIEYRDALKNYVERTPLPYSLSPETSAVLEAAAEDLAAMTVEHVGRFTFTTNYAARASEPESRGSKRKTDEEQTSDRPTKRVRSIRLIL